MKLVRLASRARGEFLRVTEEKGAHAQQLDETSLNYWDELPKSTGAMKRRPYRTDLLWQCMRVLTHQ
jgi:hypothetical protein